MDRLRSSLPWVVNKVNYLFFPPIGALRNMAGLSPLGQMSHRVSFKKKMYWFPYNTITVPLPRSRYLCRNCSNEGAGKGAKQSEAAAAEARRRQWQQAKAVTAATQAWSYLQCIASTMGPRRMCTSRSLRCNWAAGLSSMTQAKWQRIAKMRNQGARHTWPRQARCKGKPHLELSYPVD